MANEIKQYQRLTYVNLKDGRTLTTDKTPEEVYNWLSANSFIMIAGEMHSKSSINNAVPVVMDDVEALIKMQDKEIQNKMREKRKRLKQNLWKEMSLSYAQNYLANLLANYGEQ